MNKHIGKNNIDVERKQLIAKLAYDLPVLRARLGITQKELAEKVGMSRATYNAIETGKKEMPWMTFMALIGFFQNNAETLKMLKSIDGMEEGLAKLSTGTDANTLPEDN